MFVFWEAVKGELVGGLGAVTADIVPESNPSAGVCTSTLKQGLLSEVGACKC